MASRLRYVSLRTVEAIKGTGRMEGRLMLVLMMLVGFMLVGWVYSWVVALMLGDSKGL